MNQAKSLFPLSQSASRGYFGDSIAISGEYAVISASGYSSPYIETGTVFLYNYHSINDRYGMLFSPLSQMIPLNSCRMIVS